MLRGAPLLRRLWGLAGARGLAGALGAIAAAASLGACSDSKATAGDAGLHASTGADGGGPDGSASPSMRDGAPASSTSADSGSTPKLVCGPCYTIAGLEPCCTSGNECGARYLGSAGAGCVALDHEGRVDPTCPTPPEQSTGCCLPEGVCGAFYTRSFGCVPHDVFPDFAPDPVPCGSGLRPDAAPPDGG